MMGPTVGRVSRSPASPPTRPWQSPTWRMRSWSRPDSQQVVALVNNYVYMVNLAMTGQEPLTISIADPAASAFPAKRLTKVGGDFIGWGPGRQERYLGAGTELPPVRPRCRRLDREGEGFAGFGPGRFPQGRHDRQARLGHQGAERFAGQGAGLRADRGVDIAI